MKLAQIVGVARLVIIALILFGVNPFALMGVPTPLFYVWMTENKIMACLMTFFFSNFIEGQLVSTGAFEVSYNDVPLWSKLQTGRVPSPPELFQIIDNHILLKYDQ